MPSEKLYVQTFDLPGIYTQMFPCNILSLCIILEFSQRQCASVSVCMCVGVRACECECEAVDLFQWKEFTAAPFCNSSLPLYKTQQDTNMNVHLHTHTHRYSVTHNKVQ